MDLPEFLLAIADQRAAKAPHIHEAGCSSSYRWYDGLGYRSSECNCGEPQRVLAWCAAVRAVVAWAVANPLSCGHFHPSADIYHFDGHDHPVLLALAQQFADRPGFRPEWGA